MQHKSSPRRVYQGRNIITGVARQTENRSCTPVTRDRQARSPWRGFSRGYPQAGAVRRGSFRADGAAQTGGLGLPPLFYLSCERACPMVLSEMKPIKEALPGPFRVRTRVVLVHFDSKMTRLRCSISTASGCAWEMTACYLDGQPADLRQLALLFDVGNRPRPVLASIRRLLFPRGHGSLTGIGP